ncbi:tetraacyldisaccharide 4'-kinase [Massilia sp. WF1]|uniref:tetraacyldisaccharide 4'-kinase n=1 Tax=unclassified Massilia TaxID=2609279 RepID=UPI00064AF9F8|nr:MULTISPECIES: tetraacyldisaccharide 4'-kinase [unclassified Massilia]ALK96312.1 tetraacyldisaccharide 4'-kinase [Massilia sp. WG5]KLU37703.1 tetraacyldisaccharide 4'-kinase [Massilia sp. WF1]
MASSLESTLTRAWLRRGPLAVALWPLSLPFRGLAALRRLLFRAGVLKSERLPVPVIVVGNIFIGGTGKTPLTIWLVEQLRAAGLRPGVISRGHGGDADADAGPREVLPGSGAREVGDEPLLIAARTGCPVVVGRRRAQAGRCLLERHPEVDVLVTDDGLQHYALQRDVELVLFDGRGVGNGWTLPAGPLREAPSRRRDFTVVNTPALTPLLAAAVGGRPYQMTLAGGVAEQLCDPARRLPLAELAGMPGKRIVAAAGIGNPGRFFAMLKAAGLGIRELALPDHHDFLDDPFRGLDADLILITEKDAVKCRQLEHLNNDPRLWVVPVTAQIDPALAAQIVEKCRGRPTA